MDGEAAGRRRTRQLSGGRQPRQKSARRRAAATARRRRGRSGAGMAQDRARRVSGGGVPPSGVSRRRQPGRRSTDRGRVPQRRGHGALPFRGADGEPADRLDVFTIADLLGAGCRRRSLSVRPVRVRRLLRRGSPAADRADRVEGGDARCEGATRARSRNAAGRRHPLPVHARRRRRRCVAPAHRRARERARASRVLVHRPEAAVGLVRRPERRPQHGRRRGLAGRIAGSRCDGRGHAGARAVAQRATRRRQRLLHVGNAAEGNRGGTLYGDHGGRSGAAVDSRSRGRLVRRQGHGPRE